MPPVSCIKYVRTGRRRGCMIFPEITGDCPNDCPIFIPGLPLDAPPQLQIDCLHLDRLQDGLLVCLQTGQVEDIICQYCSDFEKRPIVSILDHPSAS